MYNDYLKAVGVDCIPKNILDGLHCYNVIFLAQILYITSLYTALSFGIEDNNISIITNTDICANNDGLR